MKQSRPNPLQKNIAKATVPKKLLLWCAHHSKENVHKQDHFWSRAIAAKYMKLKDLIIPLSRMRNHLFSHTKY